MVGQNANRYRFERMTFPNRAVDAPEAIDLTNKEIARPISESDREEEYAARNLGATIPTW